jgi:hypothetical protein
LGDFDADGDFGSQRSRGSELNSAVAPELAVFDPVVATGAPSQGQESTAFPGNNFHAAAAGQPCAGLSGNFDTNVPGDEIAVSRVAGAS